jgi:hypothetical protein
MAGDHEEHRRGEVHGHAGVVGELDRSAHIGVVGADDEDDVVRVGQRVVALDDRGEGGVRVGADVAVGDADLGLVGAREAVLAAQEGDDGVARERVLVADDGAEHGDGAGAPGEQVHDADRYGGLAAAGVETGEVETLSHGSNAIHPVRAAQRICAAAHL